MLAARVRASQYEADADSDSFGQPLPGPPHAIYLDPGHQEATAAGSAHGLGARAEPKAVVLNRGKGLRPSGDARGWKWREQLLEKRDNSLLYEPDDRTVARIAKRDARPATAR